MKQARRPTRAQKMLMQKWRLNVENWLVVSDTPEAMAIRHRHSDKTRVIPKRRADDE